MSEQHPLTEQQENMQCFMNDVWEIVGKYQDRLSIYEICGILQAIQSKLNFDINVRMANDMVKQMREDNKPSPLIDKNGFPI